MRFCGVLAALALVLVGRHAVACSLPGPEPFTIDPSLIDTEVPEPVTDVSFSLRRGQAPQSDGCSQSASSCDDLGILTLYVTGGDAAPAESSGYLIEVVDGEAPEGLIPAEPVRAADSIVLPWVDAATSDQEVVAFSITVSAVDAAGNVSDPSEPIRIYDSGGSEGCTVARGFLASSWPSALVALAGFGAMAKLARRLRRSRRRLSA
jgi:hypothetical protein